MKLQFEVVDRSTLDCLSVLVRVSSLRVAENATRVILNRETEWKMVVNQLYLHLKNKGSGIHKSIFSSKENTMIHKSVTYQNISLPLLLRNNVNALSGRGNIIKLHF